MRPLRGLQEIRVATREESGVLGFPSRRGLTPRGSLECPHTLPAACSGSQKASRRGCWPRVAVCGGRVALAGRLAARLGCLESGGRLYRRNAAGSDRDAAAHCNREPRRHRPQLVPRQLLPARTAAPRTFDPETLYDARGRQKRHRRKHLPLSGRRGTPCRLLPPHRDGDPHLGTAIRKPRGGEKARCPAGGVGTGPRSPAISQSPKKGGRGMIRGIWGKSVTQKPSWDVKKRPRWLQRLLPAGPRRTPRNPARPRLSP